GDEDALGDERQRRGDEVTNRSRLRQFQRAEPDKDHAKRCAQKGETGSARDVDHATEPIREAVGQALRVRRPVPGHAGHSLPSFLDARRPGRCLGLPGNDIDANRWIDVQPTGSLVKFSATTLDSVNTRNWNYSIEQSGMSPLFPCIITGVWAGVTL